MEWFMLAVAGVLEVVWACAMKYSEGFSKTVPSVITVIGFLLSAVFLSLAVKKLPLGTAYAIWTGLGTVGTFALGVYLFQEHFSISKAICVLLILSGIVGLKLLH
ncbi:MAG: multidrug efflux SMR transporter [Fibrobacter sp.]|nr:multidrug efflux SMR transporter [Fibrobacter sp.]